MTQLTADAADRGEQARSDWIVGTAISLGRLAGEQVARGSSLPARPPTLARWA